MKTSRTKFSRVLVRVDVYFDFYKNVDVLTIEKIFGDDNVRREIVPNTNPSYNQIKMSLTELPVNPILHFTFHKTDF